jgi:hypothetical protein
VANKSKFDEALLFVERYLTNLLQVAADLSQYVMCNML